MQRFCVLTFLMLLAGQAFSDELDDWILPAQTSPTLINIIYQQNEDNDHTTGLNISLPIKDASVLDLGISQSQFSDDSGNFETTAFDTRFEMNASENFSVLVTYNTDGNDNELEISHYGLGFRYIFFPGYVELLSEDGELILFNREELVPLESVPEKTEMSKDGLALTIGWWFENFNIEVFHQRYEYGKDITALSDSILLQILVKPEVLSLSNLLSDELSRVSLRHDRGEQLFGLHWISDVSAIDQQRLDAWQLDWSTNLNQISSLLLSVSTTEESDWSMAAGLTWRL